LPNIFKHFSLSRAEPYQFPTAEELFTEDEELPAPEEEEGEPVTAEEPAEPEPEPEPDSPVSFAQYQADAILREARRQAEDILEQARQDGRREAEEAREAGRREGHEEGYAQGMAQAMEEGARQREEWAARQEVAVAQFLEEAGAELDRQMDESVGELRDLALAVAEKVVCISLKSSGEVISRMIQTAIDKRKRREWVHIYIAECDARQLTQVPATLTAALSALSDRVRIIPMADDESGTCIIEMPDEIVDASAGTQLNNIRSLLMDTASSGAGTI